MGWRWVITALCCAATVVGCTGTEPQAEQRGPPKPIKDGVEAPRVVGPRFVVPEIASEPPFVGEEGDDEYGYPRRRPDKVVLLGMLRLRRFEALDRFFDYYQSEFEKDYRREHWPDDALSAFGVSDPSLEPLFDAWVKASPDSFAAHAARGNYEFDLGWSYRGTAFASKTPQEKMDAMAKAHGRAAEAFMKAIALRPKFIAAHRRLALLANGSGESVDERAMLEAALESCALCYLPRATYMRGITPRWGGTYAQMDAYLKEVAPLVAKNPRLAVLAGLRASDECKTALEAKDLETATKTCDAAIAAGPEAEFLVQKAAVFRAKEDYASARATLAGALRLQPHHRGALRDAVSIHSKLKDHRGAARALITARSLSPTDERISKYLDWIVKNLDYEGDQLFKQERWDQAAEVFDLGLRLDPDNNTLMKRQGFNDKPRVDDLLAQLPARRNDFWFHLRVDHALFVSERFPEIIALWEAYLVETPDDPRAYWERAGAYYHHGNRDAWLADMKKSCDLGLQRGCDDFQRNNR